MAKKAEGSRMTVTRPPGAERAALPPALSDHQRETAFLRQCILYDDSDERHKLEENITQLQRNERCVRRAVGLMAVLIALGMAGVGYSAILLSDYPQNISRFMTQLPSKASCTLALGSLIGLLSFAALGARYRKELDQCRENCRRLALNLLEARLGKPGASPSPAVTKETSGEESRTPGSMSGVLGSGKY